MFDQSYPMKESRVLWRIRQGVPVYDCNYRHIGTVKYIRASSELAEEEGNIAERSLTHIPTDIRRRLLREGFVQVEGGSPDYYIAPKQVCEIQDKQIILNVMKTDIMRF